MLKSAHFLDDTFAMDRGSGEEKSKKTNVQCNEMQHVAVLIVEVVES